MKHVSLGLTLVVLLFQPPITALAQEMRPLGEVLETSAAPYPATRCSAWYHALMEWGGSNRFKDQWETMDVARRSTLMHAILIFNETSGNSVDVDAGIVVENVKKIKDLYYNRMSDNYAASGEAFGQDELIKSDMILCQMVAELAISVVGDLGG